MSLKWHPLLLSIRICYVTLYIHYSAIMMMMMYVEMCAVEETNLNNLLHTEILCFFPRVGAKDTKQIIKRQFWTIEKIIIHLNIIDNDNIYVIPWSFGWNILCAHTEDNLDLEWNFSGWRRRDSFSFVYCCDVETYLASLHATVDDRKLYFSKTRQMWQSGV